MKNLNNKLVSGVDEAGRGSIIGPLVIACVTADKKIIRKFSKLGVKDSKKVTPKNREILSKIIMEESQHVSITRLSEKKIDKAVRLRKEFAKKKNYYPGNKIIGLNELEANSIAKMMNELKSSSIYVDSCDVNPERFKQRIINRIDTRMKIYSRHKADERYIIVAAASIIAKFNRDKEILKLERIHGNIGSGYPSDQITRRFLREWIIKNKEMPDFTRKSWKTWIDLQPKIEDYL